MQGVRRSTPHGPAAPRAYGASGEPRRASVRAANGCRLFVIDHESFKSVLSQNPEVARAISEKVAERAASSARKSDAATPAVPVSSSDLFERIRRFFGKR